MPTGSAAWYFLAVPSTPSPRPRSASLSITASPSCRATNSHSCYDQQPPSTSSPPSHAPCPYKYPALPTTRLSSPSTKRFAAHNSALALTHSPSISKSFANGAN